MQQMRSASGLHPPRPARSADGGGRGPSGYNRQRHHYVDRPYTHQRRCDSSLEPRSKRTHCPPRRRHRSIGGQDMSDKPRSILERDWPYPGDIEGQPTPPLPEEIAGLIERLREASTIVAAEGATALRALVQENERLRKERDERLQAKAERIAELEAEVHRLQNNEVNDCDLLGMHERRIAELEAERGAIQAKTIEECAQVADGWDFGKPIAKDIRALAQTDESKTESGE